MILNEFLPMSLSDLEQLKWEGVDFVLISGDAYVDRKSVV